MKARTWITAGVFALVLITGALPARAAPTLSAEVDPKEITEDESVSLKLTVQADGSDGIDGAPQIEAPDFDVINEFSSTVTESYYENGNYGMRNTRQLTRVLRPKRTGKLAIRNIKVKTDSGWLEAQPITVTVRAAGTAPGGATGGVVTAAAAKGGERGFFLRAEASKTRVFRGEQVVVSYYLYRRVRVFNIQVDKYPALPGFLREDLEMPVLQARLGSERVQVGGVAYDRSLLVRYAAYPLKEGRLELDPMGLRSAYYPPGRSAGQVPGFDEDDPFASFFQQVAPAQAQIKSDPVAIEVVAVPEAGRPAKYSGGVGEFTVTAALDRTSVRPGEAVTLTVLVEGRGSLSSLELPTTAWPPGFEQYESKGEAKSNPSGINQKKFEILLIPRETGSFALPKIEFVFFDPKARAYVTRSTQPVNVIVQGTAIAAGTPAKQAADAASTGPSQAATSGELPEEAQRESDRVGGLQGPGGWTAERWERVLWIALALAWLVGVAVAVRLWMSRRRKRGASRVRVSVASGESEATLTDSGTPRVGAPVRRRDWGGLARQARDAATGKLEWSAVLTIYERLASHLYDLLDRRLGVESRALPRSELEERFAESGAPREVWSKLARILEAGETVRYASGAGAIGEAQARADLAQWVRDAEFIETQLSKEKNSG